MPSRPRFLLETEDGSAGSFAHAKGLEDQLIGCEQQDPRHLISLLDGEIFGSVASLPPKDPARKHIRTATNASLTFLDNMGNRLFSHFLGPVTACKVFGARQNGIVSELVLSMTNFDPLPLGLSEVLASWSDGIPTVYNRWHDLSHHGRRAWLHAISARSPVHSSFQRECRSHYVLRTDNIVDYPGVFLALGEALNGPCGYYGSNLDAVEDCLAGGFGPTPPFTLEWRGGKTRLPKDAWVREKFWREWETLCDQDLDSLANLDILDSLADLLRDHSVSVVLTSEEDE